MVSNDGSGSGPDARESQAFEAPPGDRAERSGGESGGRRRDDPCGSRRARHSRRHRSRKERVLHTRISEELAEDIRRMADDLRVPVSNIVRTVLEEAFSVVERVTGDVGELIEEVVDEAEAARDRIRRRHRHRRRRHARRAWEDGDEAAFDTGHRPTAPEMPAAEPDASPPAPSTPEDELIGWQPLLLARDRECAGCGARLARGAQAYAPIRTDGVGGAVRCGACVGA